jgi:hypothetical protein
MSLSSFLLGEKAAGKQKAIDTELDALFQIQVRLSYFWFDYNSSESIIYRFIRPKVILVLQHPMARSVNRREVGRCMA